MVESLVLKLAAHDPHWIFTHDCCGGLSNDPFETFLAANKMICYGVSFSAFWDCFQMGQSTARDCLCRLS